MNIHGLFIIGTPFGDWPEAAAAASASAGRAVPRDGRLARWLDGELGAGLPAIAAARRDAPRQGERGDDDLASEGGLDARGAWRAELLARRFAQARFVIVVEDPRIAVARWLKDGGEGTLGDLLRLWVEGARALPALIHAHPRRCLVVDARDLVERPAAAARHLAAWAGGEAAVAAGPGEVAARDPLTDWIAGLLVERHAGALDLHAQLLASCAVIDGVTAAEAPAPAADDAVAALRVAHARSARWPALAEEHERLRMQAAGLETETAALLVDLQATQESCAATHERLRDAERRLAEQGAVAASKAALAEAEAAARREQNLLLAQIDQLQQELERRHIDARAAAVEAQDVVQAGPAGGAARAATVKIGHERDEAPHRELSLTLGGLRLARGGLPEIDVRLVEHHGRVGLVLFAAPGRPATLSSFEASGQEDGVPYMLIVPEDLAGARALARMPTSDWEVLEVIVEALGYALAGQRRLSARWPVAVQRLARLLQRQPDRLRFDDIAVRAVAGEPGWLEADLHNVVHGARRLDGLRVRWQPAPGAPGLVRLLVPPSGLPPLLHWPIDEDGAWAMQMTLPLPFEAAPAQRGAWNALHATDRALVHDLLDALPALAMAVADDALPPGFDRPALIDAAAEPLRALLRAQRREGVRDAARTLLRRRR